MTVGAMTQFLMNAQGMPKSVLTTLTKTTRDFIWNRKKSPPLSLKRLHKPQSEGGINLLDLKARNLAIEVTWLKKYLDMTKARPTWAFVTDTLINCIKPSGIRSLSNVNIFLTFLRAPIQVRQCKSNRKQILMRVITLLKSAKRVNLCLAPCKLSRKLKKQLPAWFHVGVPSNLYDQWKMGCLKNVHNAETIRHLLQITKRATDHNSPHQPHPSCNCKDCTKDR